MLALRIEYLTGRVVATSYNDRQSAEWPPHPARVFSALVATWAECAPRDPDEHALLVWLATLPPPSLHASSASARAVLTHFVPVNDIAVLSEPTALRDKVDAATTALAEAQTELTGATLAHDKAAVKRAEKAVAKAEKALDKHRADLRKRLAADQVPEDGPSDKALKSARAILPETRTRQARFFPSLTPDDPVVHLVWDGEAPEAHRRALSALARRVVRIGHASSLVACSLVDHAPPPTLVPRDDGTLVLRVPQPGQVDQLDAAFAMHREMEPRVLPCAFQRYGAPAGAAPAQLASSHFGVDWIVLRRVGGPRLPMERTVDVARALRGALMTHAAQPVASVLSGHQASGEPARTSHAAFVPLPFVGHARADGSLLGVAIVLPSALADAERAAVLRALGDWEAAQRESGEDAPMLPLQLGAAGVLEVERVVWGVAPQSNLQPETWCRPSTTWVTVTPIALDRNPGDLNAADPTARDKAFATAEAIVAASCGHVALPAPREVVVLPSVPFAGAIKARQFPAYPPEANKTRRVKVHAMIRFDVPVSGPVLLGAGRYVGLGLLRPVFEGEVRHVRADR